MIQGLIKQSKGDGLCLFNSIVNWLRLHTSTAVPDPRSLLLETVAFEAAHYSNTYEPPSSIAAHCGFSIYDVITAIVIQDGPNNTFSRLFKNLNLAQFPVEKQVFNTRQKDHAKKIWERYLDLVSANVVWPGELEIRALSCLLGKEIVVCILQNTRDYANLQKLIRTQRKSIHTFIPIQIYNQQFREDGTIYLLNTTLSSRNRAQSNHFDLILPQSDLSLNMMQGQAVRRQEIDLLTNQLRQLHNIPFHAWTPSVKLQLRNIVSKLRKLKTPTNANRIREMMFRQHSMHFNYERLERLRAYESQYKEFLNKRNLTNKNRALLISLIEKTGKNIKDINSLNLDVNTKRKMRDNAQRLINLGSERLM
jgi:OTU-like cysteine protease